MNESRSTPKLVAIVLAWMLPAGAGRALTLAEAVGRALEHSPRLVAAEAARDEAAASARLSRDAFHPEAWASTTPGYSSGLPTAIAGRVPAIASVDLRQTLYNGPARAEALQADAAAAVQSGEAEKSRRDTARAAALLYTRCWADEARLASARRRQAASEEILRRTAALAQEGRRTDLDLERARLEAAKSRQRTLDVESDRDLDARELRIAIGAEPGSPVEIAEDPDRAIAKIPIAADAERLRAEDPALRSLDLEIESLRRSATAAGKAVSPVIEAEGQYSRLSRANHYDRYYRSFKADDWSVGVSVAVPLWSGGRLADARAKLESRITRAAADRADRAASLDLALARALSALDRAEAAASLADRAEGVAREALRIGEALRREGRAEPDEVEKRTIELSDSEEEAVRSRVERLTARCDLLSLSGDLAALAR